MTNDVEIRSGFTRNYNVSRVIELPMGQEIFDFPKGRSHDIDGVVLQITYSDEEPWLGRFAGTMPQKLILYSTPDPDCLCVVSESVFYIIDAKRPPRLLQSHNFFDLKVIAIPKANLFLTTDNWWAYAWNGRSLEWRSQLELDPPRFADFEGDILIFTGWSPSAKCS